MKDLNNHSIAYKRILYIKKQMENEDLKKILNRFTFLCRFASSFMAVLLYALTTQSLFAQECKKGSIVNLQRSHQNKKITPSTQPINIGQASEELRNKFKKIEYKSKSLGKIASIDEYITKNCINAFAVVKDGKLIYEKYFNWTSETDQLYSASMAKSLTSIMVGVLLDQGNLKLSTKVADIIPELNKSAFAEDTVEDLLRMNSSAKLRDCNQNCTDEDNIKLNPMESPRTNTLEYLSKKIEVGNKSFFYSAANTAILGSIIKRISGQEPEKFWAEKVWEPIGAESDGHWITNSRQELGFQCCYTARARDWLKLGVMLANYGEINQRRVLSTEYVQAMASINIKNPMPPYRSEYGLHVWIPRMTPRSDLTVFEMHGLGAQALVIDPVEKIVIFQSGYGQAQNSIFADWPEFRYAILNALK